jgi:hypothetical protein
MKRMIIALAVALPAFGAAQANDLFSTLYFPEAGPVSSRHANGDAAPRSTVKNPRRASDFSSSAAMAPAAGAGKISSRYFHGDAPLPSSAPNTARSFGYSSSAPMAAHAPSKLGASPRILDGSN